MEDNVIFQDNKSAMLMEGNGRNSCTGNSRHINIRYFFIKDRIKNKEVRVAYCPTELMLADYFTKPLQGSLFNKFRSVIMGYENISSIFPPDISESEERVGINKFNPADSENVSKNAFKGKSKKVESKSENRTYVRNSVRVSWSDVVSKNMFIDEKGEKRSGDKCAVYDLGSSSSGSSSSNNADCEELVKNNSSTGSYVRTPV